MRISELSAATDVPVATIKHYLREGLLPPGELTSRTQASYSDEHIARLRLIRALMESAQLSTERVRQVLAAIDAPPPTIIELLRRATDPESSGSHVRSAAFLAEIGWEVHEGLGAFAQLERALAGLERAGFTVPPSALAAIVEHVDAIAAAEIEGTPTGSPREAVTYAVLGTELLEPLILALRRIAHARHAIARFDAED